MIEKYLAPLKEDKEDKKRIQSDLITLRNKMTGAYFLINSLWIVLTFSLTLAIQDINITFNDRNGNEIVLQPLSFLFLIFFLVILLIQFVTMLIHRWSTFVHLMAATVIGNEENDKNNAKTNTIPNQSTSKKVDGKKNKKKKSKKLSVEDVNETIGSGVENRAFDSNFSTKTITDLEAKIKQLLKDRETFVQLFNDLGTVMQGGELNDWKKSLTGSTPREKEEQFLSYQTYQGLISRTEAIVKFQTLHTEESAPANVSALEHRWGFSKQNSSKFGYT
ncbi:uncharacterized protein LOC144425870 [Styela clava]